jgi:hypothetical protein
MHIALTEKHIDSVLCINMGNMPLVSVNGGRLFNAGNVNLTLIITRMIIPCIIFAENPAEKLREYRLQLPYN